MHVACWQLHQHDAQFRWGSLAARIDLSAPARGLQDVKRSGRLVPGAGLLGVEIPASGAAAAAGMDAYVRGIDLVATYAAAAERPFRTQLYWRAWTSGVPGATVVELVASVQTALLDSYPRLFTTSRLAAAEVLRLMDPARQRFAVCTPAGTGSLALRPHEGCGCLLLRSGGDAGSYAEMVHPVDFGHSEVARETRAGSPTGPWCSLRHQLFAASLEKGVILRARVLAAWVDRSGDEEAVATLYREFAASEPPLTT